MEAKHVFILYRRHCRVYDIAQLLYMTVLNFILLRRKYRLRYFRSIKKVHRYPLFGVADFPINDLVIDLEGFPAGPAARGGLRGRKGRKTEDFRVICVPCPSWPAASGGLRGQKGRKTEDFRVICVPCPSWPGSQRRTERPEVTQNRLKCWSLRYFDLSCLASCFSSRLALCFSSCL